MKKILYITSQDSDYLQDMMYQGFVQSLGHERIICWPWKWAFQLPRKPYPRNLGLPKNSWMALVPNALSYLRWNFSHSWSDISMVILAATKPDAFENYLEIQKSIPRDVPVVFFDGGDRPEIAGDLDRLKSPELFQKCEETRPFDFIFKREMLIGREYPSHVFPLPFPVPSLKIPQFHFSESDRKYDVTFWAVESDPVRTMALRLIEDRFDCRENGTTRNQVFKKYKRKGLFYLEELARSKVILNFRGVGWDTLRYWEAFGLGRFLISQEPQIQIPNNFKHQEEIIFCKDDGSDLVDLCEYYLKDESRREEIAKKGALKARQFHSEFARVKFVLEKMKV